MTMIKKRLDALAVESPATFRNLTVYPLTAPPAKGGPDYLTLDQGLAARSVKITEVSQGGSVPELKLQNRGDKPLLMIDGEEMVGAKQNRVINLTVMAGAGTTVVIPVSCVEAGRWQHTSAELEASPQTMHASGRAGKMAGVTRMMEQCASRASDQGAVWDDISGKMGRMKARSSSREMKAIFDEHRGSIDDFVRAFSPVANQVGAVFIIGDRVAGLELFDHVETLAGLYPKLIRSYALDALDTRYAGKPGEEPSEAVQQRLHDEVMLFIASVGLARATSHPAIGLGDDLRINNNAVTGAALTVGQRLVHLSAFPIEERTSHQDSGRQGGMTSASRRRGFRR